MKQLVFATGNQNKVKEIKNILGDFYSFLSLSDIGCTEDIPETQPTIAANALQKAQYVYEKYHCNCFAEDTGLLVDALDGAPGVYSARYAGEQRNAQDNTAKLLEEMKGKTNRNAHFKTVIALILDGKEYLFEGIVEGVILEQAEGLGGFGYDPIFLPKGATKNFAKMTASEKSAISHRGRATALLKEFLIGQ